MLYAAAEDRVCVWDGYSVATFDLRPLMTSGGLTYRITDGDIPCTPEVESAYTYEFKLCADLSQSNLPAVCKTPALADLVNGASAVQYIEGQECHPVGRYDNQVDDLMYSLYDAEDPSKGVSLKYLGYDNLRCHGGVVRSLTVDVICADRHGTSTYVVETANEPEVCQYHATMESVWGCPRECPLDRNNRLCSTHGHCAFDPVRSKPRCFCNHGWGGDDCGHKVKTSKSSSSSGKPTDVQIGLLVPLILISLGLVGTILYMMRQVMSYRVEAGASYASLAGEETRNELAMGQF